MSVEPLRIVLPLLEDRSYRDRKPATKPPVIWLNVAGVTCQTYLTVLMTLWLMVLPCRAQESKVALINAITVEPGATCLDGLALVEHVRRWLGKDEVDRRIRISVKGSTESQTEATFFLDKGDGRAASRYFSAGPSDCSDFHSAVGLSIAMAIQAAYLDRQEKSPTASSEGASGIERTALSLFGLRTSGLLTGLAWGGQLALEAGGWFEWLDFRLGAILTHLGEQQLDAPELDSPQQFDALIAAGRLDLCGAQTVSGAVRFRSCLGAMLGGFRTRGYNDVKNHKTVTKPWGAVGLTGQFSVILLEKLSIAAEVDLVVPWWKRTIRLEIEGSETSEVPSEELNRVGFLFGVGPVIQF
jgi:hypothetical protein